MKKRDVMALLGTMTVVTVGSTLTGCGCSRTEDTVSVNEVTVSENEAVSENIADVEDETETVVEPLPWIEVGELDNLPELRASFDELVGVTGEPGSKTGWVYDTQNITLQDALENEDFINLLYGPNNEDSLATLVSIIDNNFTDTEDLSQDEKIAILLNEYFSLLPSEEDGVTNPYDVLTRAQAMTILMRATNPVSDIETNAEFTAAVGNSPWNDYAFVSTLDGSLDPDTYGKPMTKAEAVYLIVQSFYKTEYDKNAYIENTLPFTDIVMSDSVGGSTNIEYLNSMIENKAVDARIMDAYQVAYHHNLFDKDTTESEWNENITKVEFLQLLVRAMAPDSLADPDEEYEEDSSSSSTSDTSDTSSYDLYDSAMNKIDTDPSTLTEEEAAYLKELYPTLTKDPREMTTQEWYAFWDNLYSAGSTSTTTVTVSDCSSDCEAAADCEVWDCGECYNGLVFHDCDDFSDTSHMDPNWTCDC